MTGSISRAFRGAVVAVLALSCVTVRAADFPTKPVRIVVAYPAGSTMDVLARMLATELQTTMGVPFLVDNKPGASGQIGAEFVAQAPPDGHTLFISGSSTHSANPALIKQLRYDPVKDFTPILQVASLTYALVVSADLPVKSIKELAQYAKTRPNGISYAYGSQLAQIAGAAVSKMAGIDAVGVPYKGQPPAMTDVIGGQVEFMIADVPVLVPQIRGGKMRAIAVLNNARSPLLPDIPTLEEQGYSGYDLVGWIGLSAPARTPEPVVKALSEATAKALSNPAMRSKLSGMGMEYEPNSAAKFGKLIATQLGVWSKKARDAGIQPE